MPAGARPKGGTLKLETYMSSEKIIFFIVFASAIPIITNILVPGMVGIPSLIAKLMIAYFLYYFYGTSQYDSLDGKNVLGIWIFILLIGIFRAFIFNYSSYDGIRDSILALLNLAIVYCVYLGSFKNIIYYLRAFVVIMLPCAIFSDIIWKGYGLTDVAHILYPISMFLLLVPYMNKKWKMILIVIALYSIFHDISVRANILLLGFSFILLILFACSKRHYSIRLKKTIWVGCLTLPIIFLFLGISGRYNIFTELMSSPIQISGGTKDRSYFVDSRTIVYVDVFNSIDNTESLIFGKSPVSKIKTHMALRDSSYREGRNSTESGFLNILYFYGIIGVICFWCLVAYSSYKAIFCSNNKLAILLGLFVSFKFLFFFIEEPSFSMVTYFAIGLCLNPAFREMVDENIKESFSGKG